MPYSLGDLNLTARRLTGRCRSGAERDSGVLYHAVPADQVMGGGKALCGVKPSLRGNGWSERSGDEVTLVDQFEPGDPRASSGGESRLLRSAHGPHADYTASARRARTLWRELEAESGEDLYLECGLTWFAQRDDAWEAQSIPVLAAQGIPYQRLAPDDGALLFPSWDPSGLRFLLHEPEAGVVRAQRAVQTLVRRAAAHGAPPPYVVAWQTETSAISPLSGSPAASCRAAVRRNRSTASAVEPRNMAWQAY